MTNRLLTIVLWLLLGTMFLAASVSKYSYASPLTYTVPQIAVSLLHPRVAPGTTQSLAIQIDELKGRRTSLILVVTYPNGDIARSLHSIESGQGTITWTIPSDVGEGEASFRLIADGCTCGEADATAQQAAVDGTLEGTFVIRALRESSGP